MIDYIFSYTSSSAAAADPILSQYYNASSSGWDTSRVIPGHQSWSPANDSTTITVSTLGSTNRSVVHTLSSGWWCSIAVPARSTVLEGSAGFMVGLDRDAANAGALPASYIVAFNASKFPSVISLLNTLRFQPVFEGAHYPALGVST